MLTLLFEEWAIFLGDIFIANHFDSIFAGGHLFWPIMVNAIAQYSLIFDPR
jgi:hypothetical protein